MGGIRQREIDGDGANKAWRDYPGNGYGTNKARRQHAGVGDGANGAKDQAVDLMNHRGNGEAVGGQRSKMAESLCGAVTPIPMMVAVAHTEQEGHPENPWGGRFQRPFGA